MIIYWDIKFQSVSKMKDFYSDIKNLKLQKKSRAYNLEDLKRNEAIYHILNNSPLRHEKYGVEYTFYTIKTKDGMYRPELNRFYLTLYYKDDWLPFLAKYLKGCFVVNDGSFSFNPIHASVERERFSTSRVKNQIIIQECYLNDYWGVKFPGNRGYRILKGYNLLEFLEDSIKNLISILGQDYFLIDNFINRYELNYGQKELEQLRDLFAKKGYDLSSGQIDILLKKEFETKLYKEFKSSLIEEEKYIRILR